MTFWSWFFGFNADAIGTDALGSDEWCGTHGSDWKSDDRSAHGGDVEGVEVEVFGVVDVAVVHGGHFDGVHVLHVDGTVQGVHADDAVPADNVVQVDAVEGVHTVRSVDAIHAVHVGEVGNVQVCVDRHVGGGGEARSDSSTAREIEVGIDSNLGTEVEQISWVDGVVVLEVWHHESNASLATGLIKKRCHWDNLLVRDLLDGLHGPRWSAHVRSEAVGGAVAVLGIVTTVAVPNQSALLAEGHFNRHERRLTLPCDLCVGCLPCERCPLGSHSCTHASVSDLLWYMVMRKGEHDLPALADGETIELTAMHGGDVTTQEPGVLEAGWAEAADLLATLNDELAFGDPVVGVGLAVTRHLESLGIRMQGSE